MADTTVPWPEDWPCVQIDDWNLEPAPHVITSEMENGAPRVRVISRARNDRVNASFVMSRGQFGAFRRLFESDAPGHGGYGGSWFLIPMFIGRSVSDGEGGYIVPDTTLEACRFLGSWKAAAEDTSGKYIRVSCQLEIRD